MFASKGGEAGNMTKEEFDLWPLLSSVAICEQGVKPHFLTLMAAFHMDSLSLKIFKLSKKNVGGWKVGGCCAQSSEFACCFSGNSARKWEANRGGGVHRVPE